MPDAGESLFWIALCAVLAPLLSGIVFRHRVPEVVLLLVLGVVIGPYVLGLAATGQGVEMLRQLGLGMLSCSPATRSSRPSSSAAAGGARSSRGSSRSASRSAWSGSSG